MSITIPDLTRLRNALLDLPSSGPNGFEGLLATVFAKLLGVPFRLAKSGSQFGVDGKTSDPAFPVAFEAKRYKDDVPSTEVLNKIGALAIRADPVELWILGTTGVVASQVADDLEALAAIHGFATLILDWQPEAPRLAALLVEARAEVDEFLNRNVPTAGLAAGAIADMQLLSSSADLADIAASALCQLRAASVATPMAQIANRRWLHDTLSNRIRAKSRLGQALTPLEAGGSTLVARSQLLAQLQADIQRPPEARLIAVLGDEGNGKSWLTITACVGLPTSPLVVVLSPEEFVTIPEGVSWDAILARKLITQTEESIAEKAEARWQRRFERWRKAEVSPSPRILVLVDGLNQRADIAWGRHIDSLVLHTSELGGCTVVTSRSEYFRRHVEPRLLSPITSIVVPPWTAPERDQVLADKGVAGSRLQPAVANTLLNPRLLGVALTLLDAQTLESLEALSVTWLLFEHLRMLDRERSDSHSAIEFADMLQAHAKDILARVRLSVPEDVTIFNHLEPAAEGRFFQWVEGEQHRYTLREQGLTFALGLAVIEELRSAVRNGRDVQESLQTVLEPIAALDQTADATIAALTLACLDQQVPRQVGVALVVGFAQLQNPGDHLLGTLTGLACLRVRVFCEACEVLWMTPNPAPNADWLEDTLQAIKHQPEKWKEMQHFLGKWLHYWWPDASVERKVRQAQGSTADVRHVAESDRDRRLNSLSEVEREYLCQLIPQSTTPYRLLTLALRLCAGMPLEGLASSLACTSFSIALMASLPSPDDDLVNLILFNRRDWSATRDQLLAHATRFASPCSSESGRWAAVRLLRATGAHVDSAVAHNLLRELTKDRARSGPWRRVERYCETDPCDPNSDRPDNIADTAREYAQLDVDKLKLFMSSTEHDHFLDSALTGLARFSPGVAVKKHRDFLSSIPSRRGLPLRQATWAALDHAALIDDELAARLLALSTSLACDPSDVEATSVDHVQQGLLLAAFPRLSPQEQFAGVDAVPDPNRIWIELLHRAKDGSPSELMNVVRLRGPSDQRTAVPLVLAGSLDVPPELGLAGILPDLLASPHPLVRSAAFHLAGASSDLGALRAVVASGWTSETASRSTREHIAASLALIEAARKGVVAAREILPRIAPETFGAACARFDDASVGFLAVTLDACVRATSGFDAPLPPVKIVAPITRGADVGAVVHSLEEAGPAPRSFVDALKSLSEGEAEFDARQKRLQDAYEAFVDQLTPQISAVILDAFGFDEAQTILRVAPELVHGWIDLLRAATADRRRALRNFGLYLACALTQSESSSDGIELLALLQKDRSFVQVRYTEAGLPLEAVALWRSVDGVEVNGIRYSRLDACSNDQELALEAATAIYAGKTTILKAYVHERLNSPHPIDIARAITVAGYSDDAILVREAAATFDGDEGILATAARSSRYAMDRHQWSKHWFEKMLAASTEEEFWAASHLFLKVVDARFDAEHRDELAGSEVFNTWWWSVERRLKRSFERRANKRKKTLFGSEAPDSIFLPEAQKH